MLTLYWRPRDIPTLTAVPAADRRFVFQEAIDHAVGLRGRLLANIPVALLMVLFLTATDNVGFPWPVRIGVAGLIGGAGGYIGYLWLASKAAKHIPWAIEHLRRLRAGERDG